MTVDAKTAPEPSTGAVTTVEPKFDAADAYTWSDEQRDHWNRTGEQPVPPKKQETAPASTPEKKGESEPKGKSAAVAEPAKSQEKKERRPGEKLTADERIAQLNARAKQLEAELAEARKSTATKPIPDAKAAEPAKVAEAPKRPNPFTWKGTPEEYEQALDAWEGHQKQQAVAEYQRNEQMRAEQDKFRVQLEDGKKRYGDFETVIKPAVEALLTEAKDTPAVVQQALNRSPHLVDVLYVLGGDKQGLKDFIVTAKTDPVAAIQKLFFVEQEVAKELAKGTAKSDEKSDEDKPDAKAEAKSDKDNPVEPKPRAPKPPSEVGGRGAPGDRPDVSAARTGNFAAFEAEQRRKAAASIR